ncbi:MAG: hypothetical protein EA377_07125 [Phycisphaerales bacterium]|nr:MAG: hypothetical protein EA377_07125 [Phycisphaerales bacterium]
MEPKTKPNETEVVPPASAEGDEGARERLAALGAESSAERAAKTAVPWLVSLSLHAGLILLGFLITWTVVMLTGDEDPTLVVADFDDLTYDPVVVTDAAESPADDAITPDLDVPPVETDQPDDVDLVDLESLDLLGDLDVAPAERDFAPEPQEDAARFMGVSTSNAREIVYVIDASGPMIAYLQIVLRELTRSLDQLSDEQRFGIVFFQRDEAIAVPPPRRLATATEAEKRRALNWIDDNIIPRGRSNPISALETALQLNPDVVFVLSVNITGAGVYEVDQADLLQRLEELNPVHRRTGQRRTQINCIQFLDPDPLDTLRVIADIHGGSRGYRFVSRAELGLASP